MINNFNKNLKFLPLFNLSYIEKYLQELINLSFEYSSDFLFSYTINDFKNLPINLLLFENINSDCFYNFLYLINTYLDKDSFFNSIYLYLNFNLKIKLNNLFQILNFKGSTSISNFDYTMLSNFNYGLNLKDFILSSFRTRESIIDSTVNISSSGYLTRKLTEGLRDFNVKEIKCNTKYVCFDFYNRKVVNIPFLCNSSKSVCSYCLNASNKCDLFMGYNKGVISGQALGEPSTQMLLRTFHLNVGFKNYSKNFKCKGSVNYCEKNYYNSGFFYRFLKIFQFNSFFNFCCNYGFNNFYKFVFNSKIAFNNVDKFYNICNSYDNLWLFYKVCSYLNTYKVNCNLKNCFDFFSFYRF